MFKTILKPIIIVGVTTLIMTGCAPSIPMAPVAQDKICKQFSKPAKDKSGIYIYRNTFVGSALTKSLLLDDKPLGPIANKTYHFKEVNPGKHKLTTTSEFSPNSILVQTKGGENYYFNHYIKIGLIVGGANIEQVTEEVAKKEILECGLAKS